MLEDAAGIRRVVLACGTVDLRKGIDGLATIIGDRYGQNPFEKGTCSCFAGNVLTGARGFYGWERGFCFCTKDLRTEDYPGQEISRKRQSLQRTSTGTS